MISVCEQQLVQVEWREIRKRLRSLSTSRENWDASEKYDSHEFLNFYMRLRVDLEFSDVVLSTRLTTHSRGAEKHPPTT